jgi:hypothetical protein
MREFERRRKLERYGNRIHTESERGMNARSASFDRKHTGRRRFPGNQAAQHWLRSVVINGRLTGGGSSSLDDESRRETGQAAEASQTQRPETSESQRDIRPEQGRMPLDDLTITAAPENPSTAKANAPAPQSPQSGPACPYTAELLGFVLGAANQTCTVPSGHHGASRLAQYGVSGAPSTGSLTVGEQFTALDDPYNVFSKLKPNTYTMSGGRFDDCYSLYSTSPLPPDFVLKIEQNHLIGGNIISQNRITYTASNVHVCSHSRLQGSCAFSKRCK